MHALLQNALCAFAVTTLLLTITSMEQLRAGELVQFDAVSADAGSLRLLGYLARPEDRVQARFLPSSFFITAPALMISSSPGPTG